MTKVDIYSGFLGAGKTTLIKKMISEGYCGEKLVLIENEFGEIGIDSGFLQDAGINITEMNSGCICCSLVGDFGKALTKVIEEYAPDRIVIEPSGVGKLSDVIAAVEKVTNDDVTLCHTVAVVDAGIDGSHEDLKANYLKGKSFVKGVSKIVVDDHGTHVAGTIAAVNNNGIGVSGLAGGDAANEVSGVKLLSCQIFAPDPADPNVYAVKCEIYVARGETPLMEMA